MPNTTDTTISVSGFSSLGAEHDGKLVIRDCERQIMDGGSFTYVPNTYSFLRFTQVPCEPDSESQSSNKTYTLSHNFCNDAWSKADPSTSTISGNNPFFLSRTSGNLRRQASHTGGPTIARLGLVSAEVGELVATQAENKREDGTVIKEFPVYETTYNFKPITETDDYYFYESMGTGAKVVEIIRRGVESVADKM